MVLVVKGTMQDTLPWECPGISAGATESPQEVREEVRNARAEDEGLCGVHKAGVAPVEPDLRQRLGCCYRIFWTSKVPTQKNNGPMSQNREYRQHGLHDFGCCWRSRLLLTYTGTSEVLKILDPIP